MSLPPEVHFPALSPPAIPERGPAWFPNLRFQVGPHGGARLPLRSSFILRSGWRTERQRQPRRVPGTSPVRVARVLGPLPGCLSEGATSLEHLKGDAVALGRTLFPSTPRTTQRIPLGCLTCRAACVPTPLSVNGDDSALLEGC